eukprot:845413-Rhodomonas_salina.1
MHWQLRQFKFSEIFVGGTVTATTAVSRRYLPIVVPLHPEHRHYRDESRRESHYGVSRWTLYWPRQSPSRPD